MLRLIAYDTWAWFSPLLSPGTVSTRALLCADLIVAACYTSWVRSSRYIYWIPFDSHHSRQAASIYQDAQIGGGERHQEHWSMDCSSLILVQPIDYSFLRIQVDADIHQLVYRSRPVVGIKRYLQWYNDSECAVGRVWCWPWCPLTGDKLYTMFWVAVASYLSCYPAMLMPPLVLVMYNWTPSDSTLVKYLFFSKLFVRIHLSHWTIESDEAGSDLCCLFCSMAGYVLDIITYSCRILGLPILDIRDNVSGRASKRS